LELDQKLAEDIVALLDEEVELPHPVSANSRGSEKKSTPAPAPASAPALAAAVLPSPELKVRAAQKQASAAMRRSMVARTKYDRLLEQHGSTGTKQCPQLWPKKKAGVQLTRFVKHIVDANLKLRDALFDSALAAAEADHTQLQLHHAEDELAWHRAAVKALHKVAKVSSGQRSGKSPGGRDQQGHS